MHAQTRVIGASVIELMANPQKFDKQVVDVTAYLVIEHQQRHAPQATLWLHQEDAKNLLPNGLAVVPNGEMLKDVETINNMYVRLRGTFHATSTVGGGFALSIKDVQSCSVWSNPQRPVGSGQEH